jgi:ArsR family transcriptional regulator, arsenate/arsenite/antimonite-responsive transcriptional repressor
VNLLEEPPAQEARPRSNETTFSPDPLPQLIQLFRLLADETRLRILRLLIETGEHHVRALCDKLGQSQPAVSHHLALMRTAGLIECRRQGKHNFYRLALPKFEEALNLVFAGKPVDNQRLRIGKYVLSCNQPSSPRGQELRGAG